MTPRATAYLPPPVTCERLETLVGRFGGCYQRSSDATGTDVQHGVVAQLPNGRVLGSGTVLSPDGRAVAIDVSTDFGGPADSHWLLGYNQIRLPLRLPGATAVVAVNLGHRYCHWLLEELPRLLALNRAESVGLIANQRAPFIREAFALGRFHGPIWTVGRHTHFECEHLIVPELIGRSGPGYAEALQRIREFTEPWRGTASGFSERLYISRENAGRRRVLNEHELWPQLAARGFVKLRPEELSWKEQINAFAHAREVVAPHGAGLANLVFCPPGVKVVEFFHRSYVNPCFGQLAACVDADYRPVVPIGPDPLACSHQGNRYDIEADVPAIITGLRT